MNMNVPHLHLLLNHIPTIGGAAAIALLIIAFVRKSDDLKRIALEATYVVALLTFPAYMSGVGAQQSLLTTPDVSQTFVDAHWDAAIFTFTLLQLAGAFSWLALWKWRRSGRWPTTLVTGVVVLSVLSFATAARTASLGGEIRHPEIIVSDQTGEEAQAAADAQAATDAQLDTDPGWISGRGLGRWITDKVWRCTSSACG